MPPLIDIPLFFLIFAGLGIPFTRIVPQAPVLTRICTGLAGAFAACALMGALIYLGNLPASTAGLLVPLAILCLLLFRKEIETIYVAPEVRISLAAWLVLCAWSLGLHALVVSYSGGGWSGDWFEHYERALFFCEHWRPDHRFLSIYSLTARPPLANLATSCLLGITGSAFYHYQIFSTLLSCLCFLPLAALVHRYATMPHLRSTALLLLLCMISPVWAQNVTFAWTKLPTAFFILAALLFLTQERSNETNSIWFKAMPWMLLSLGMLVHYSAGPWILALITLSFIQRRAEWKTREFWLEITLAGACAAALFAPWFLVSLIAYGMKDTLASNTAITGAAPGLFAQLRVTLQNAYHTLIPFIIRDQSPEALIQSSSAGYFRDIFFNSFQLCLPLLCGFSGLFALTLSAARRVCSKGPNPAFWPLLVLLATVFGIAAVTFPDDRGIAHACLTPLALLGFAAICIRYEELSPIHRALFWLLALFDFVAGTLLQFLIESFALAQNLPGASGDQVFAAGLNKIALLDFHAKQALNIPFLGDLTRAFHPFLCILLVIPPALALWYFRGPAADRVKGACLKWLGCAALLGLLALAGHGLLNSTFMMYDDEGYILVSLKNFSDQGGLYGHVFSQYGPFFHVLGDALRHLGWPITNEGARSLTLCYWVVSASAAFFVLYRITRNHLTSALTLAVTFIYLHQLSNEPSHPGGLVCALLSLAAASVFLLQTNPRAFALLGGLIAGALLLIKINVGVFFIAGAGAWLLLGMAPQPPSLLRFKLPLAALTLLPWLLMWNLLREPWGLQFAWVTSLSFSAAFIAAHSTKQEPVPASALLAALAGLLLMGATVFAIILLRGSSPGDILNGILLVPLRQTSAYTNPVKWRPFTALIPPLSLLLAITFTRKWTQGRQYLVAILRLLLVLAFLSSWCGILPIGPQAFSLNFGLATAWLFIPPLSSSPPRTSVTSWLLLIGITQALHAYPVAGSQISWGTFLWIPLAAIGTWDALSFLTDQGTSRIAPLRYLFTCLLCAMTAFGLIQCGFLSWKQMHTGNQLNLPGAEGIVLPEKTSCTLRLLHRNLTTHCDMVFSFPGMFSFNLWTGLPSPTGINTTHWFSLLDTQQQEDIIAALMKDPHPGLIVQKEHLNYLQTRKIPTTSKLTSYLQSAFHPVFTVGSYEFWLKKDQAAIPVGQARLYRDPDTGKPILRITLAETSPIEISRLECRLFEQDESHSLASWKLGDHPNAFTLVNQDGRLRSIVSQSNKSITAMGIAYLDIVLDEFPSAAIQGETMIYLYSATGQKVSEAVLLP